MKRNDKIISALADLKETVTGMTVQNTSAFVMLSRDENGNLSATASGSNDDIAFLACAMQQLMQDFIFKRSVKTYDPLSDVQDDGSDG